MTLSRFKVLTEREFLQRPLVAMPPENPRYPTEDALKEGGVLN